MDEDEDRLDFGDDDDRESVISLGGEVDQVEDVQRSGSTDSNKDKDEAARDSVTNARDVVQEAAQHVQAPSVLPPGWAERKSRKGETYYLNTHTGKTTWELPDGPARPSSRGNTPDAARSSKTAAPQATATSNDTEAVTIQDGTNPEAGSISGDAIPEEMASIPQSTSSQLCWLPSASPAIAVH